MTLEQFFRAAHTKAAKRFGARAVAARTNVWDLWRWRLG